MQWPDARIIHFARPAQVGGTITSTLRQAALQARAGADVSVWSMLQRQSDQLPDLARAAGVRARQISAMELLTRTASFRLAGCRPDVLHMHSGQCFFNEQYPRVRRLAGPETRIVATLHGPSGLRAEPTVMEIQRHRHLAEAVDAIVVPSEYERGVQQAFGLDPARLYVAGDPVRGHGGDRDEARARLGLPTDRTIVLSCSRVAKQKGVMTLIEALGSVVWRTPRPPLLVVCGDGPHLTRCVERAGELEVEARFAGHVRDVGPWYVASDVFASLSEFESFGISAVEAALSGRPMALGAIQPWTDIFEDGRDCLFVPPRDVSAAAEAVAELVVNQERRAALAASARRRAEERFGDQRVLAELQTAYGWREESWRQRSAA